MKRVPFGATRYARIFEDAELSADYARRHAAEARRGGRLFAKLLRRRGVTPRRILDLGCGSGDTLVELADAFAQAELVGVDLCEPLLAHAARLTSAQGLSARVRLERADVCALPFEDDSFDVVISQNTLHTVADPAAMLNEGERVLADSGVVIHRVVRRTWLGVLIEGVFKTGYTRPEVEALLAESTLRPCRIRTSLLYLTVEST